MENRERLTQNELLENERWEVRVNNEVYTLNGLEVALLKRASQSEGIRLVWFKDFAINISFIESVYKVRSGGMKQIESPMRELTEEEREKAIKKLEELRKKDKKDCLFESHKKYIDIQYMFEGDEIMEVENVNNLLIETPYKEDLDYAKYAQCSNFSSLLIKENELAIFYPDDAHMPCIKVDENKKIIKAVFKIAV